MHYSILALLAIQSKAYLATGEGCLSVDEAIPGFVRAMKNQGERYNA